MRVLGVDPSLRSTGFAVLEGDRGSQRMIELGLIKTRTGIPLESTLLTIAESLEGILDRQRPDWLAIEDIYHHKDARSALLLGHVRGAVILTCRRRGMRIAQYSATRIKETITGYGRAEKVQVQAMVVRTLSLTEVPPHDAADAVAAALTHFFFQEGKGGEG